jgi:hypothetical protein
MPPIANPASNIISLRALADDDLPIVAPGNYLATYVRHHGTVVFASAKVRIDMRLVEHPEIMLSRWYRVSDYRGGRVRSGRHSDIVRELSAVLARRVRADRLPIDLLKNIFVRVAVRTVSTDHKQQLLDVVNRYSSIARLIEQVEP